MLEKVKLITNKRYFHVIILMVIIFTIFFIFGIITLRYNVEGETNMPFELTKISIISSSDGNDKEAVDAKWAYDIYQCNDIYLYINKNEAYNDTETIKNIKITNINAEGQNKEKIKLYKPDSENENLIFRNIEANEVTELEYTGDMESELKELKISNQGGLVAFRCSLDDLKEYITNEEVVNHNELLKKSEVTEEMLAIKLSFDLFIELEDGTQYKTTIGLDLPLEDIIEKGTVSHEITDVNQFIFKRVKNR